ncbi:transport ATP-binding protein MsbA [Rickettsia prowazekii str. GvV257]|uniref:Putative export ATP-binding/permease protein RP696 n=2 Tax=Rickettsia prowazekii TaxID=782 RepID=Y696_RICPR|nr:ABC transporter transmembrane domain-containing protein [Rickettsia prowazekii]Q9ZCM8.1 RecName: Full=Putative export ATP-binding/permease protein RP696 [Rickettsia prowazekii str. Madrid E]ADE30244.1 Multidrug resistance protein [Rickettsia prowazekii str. Rp22]AFE49493.1 transport ATP-binding protein MsbA [Rickettsia prowazekii str. Chernikova]AFE50337.1 transport ATP-binding protein MsbA [Rickettsia prowazekii str. Katsinyian]AFE51183.1 transport ATP-binding protein MsbA [Rickettsia prow
MDIKLLYRLAKYLRFYKKDLIIVMISLLSVSASLLLIGSIFRDLIDRGLAEDNILSVNKSILYICLLIVILSVASFFRSYFINNVAEKIVNQIRKEAYSNLINYEIEEYEELKIGDIISRLTNDIDQIATLIVNFLSFFIRNSVMLIGSITLMFFESFKLASIVIITIPILLVPLIKFGKHVKALSKKALESKSLLVSDIDETFNNIRVIYAFNHQINKIADFDTKLQSYLIYCKTRLKIRALFFAISIAVIFLTITLIVWIGASDIVQGDLSAGQIISFIYYAIIAGVSSGGIFELLSEMHLPTTALERIITIIDKTSIVHNNYYALNNSDAISIEFKNVDFTYNSRPNLKVINNMSLKINSNKFVGIVGRSGAGKSTLIQLLLRFYRQENGTILINNQDISFVKPTDIRKFIAYVPQEASIFSDTIKSNIIFGNNKASDYEINEIIKITGIEEFSTKLHDGINTKIGEKGVRLSGGQKQRIAIARALLRKPKILLLDEAMSALDTMSEQKLLNAIKKIMKGNIIISIAHRISSIESADYILVIDKGGVVTEGSHYDLSKNSEIYRNICREQLTI